MSHPIPWDEGPYLEDDFDHSLEERRFKEPAEIRRLVRLAYSQPETAGKEAKAQGLYSQMIDHMMRANRYFSYKEKKTWLS